MYFSWLVVLLVNAFLHLCSAFFFVPDEVNNLQSRVVTPVGEIIGTMKAVSFEGRSYQANRYFGIPYAEAPIGNLRFRKPIPKARFLTPFDATKAGPICLQKFGRNVPAKDGSMEFSEDCLVLNVYVPSKLQVVLQAYPVMVWIHGGWYDTGMSNIFIGDTLAAVNDVIIVTLNYRLGFLGFFSTQDADAPGNFGLWDQHLAIKWVHDNIQSFGGDPGRVTIFGESAGSSSVVHQSFYAGNQGLFQRAIAESGTNSNTWGYAGNPANYNQSMVFAEQIGCTSNDHVTLMYCLRSKSTTDVLNVVNNYDNWADKRNEHVWTATAPIVDNDFVMHDPVEMLKVNSNVGQTPSRRFFNGIDLLIGANSYDGLLYFTIWQGLLNITDANDFHFTRDGFETTIIPTALAMFFKTAPSDLGVKSAIFEYTDWSDPNNDHKRLQQIADMSTDFSLWAPTVAVVNSHSASATASTYLYEFSTRPALRLFGLPPTELDGARVASHADELVYVFGFDAEIMKGVEISYNLSKDFTTADDRAVSKTMMTMWTNFAKTGDPNSPVDISQYLPSPWLPYNKQTQTYLDITPNMTSQSVKQKIAPEAVEFWLSLLPRMNACDAP